MASGAKFPQFASRRLETTTSRENINHIVYAEQVDSLFRQMPVALAVNLVNAALVATVLAPSTSWPIPASWFAAVMLVTAGRAILWRRYRARTAGEPRRWSAWATIASALAGLAWGLGGALIFAAAAPDARLLLIIVIGGMCIGAVVFSASHLPALLAFLLTACLPMAARSLAEASAAGYALAAMIVVFTAAMGLAGRHLNRILGETMRLRFELAEAGERLKAEIAERRAAEAALHQAQKLEALGQLTGGIAHDFNNLLSIITGNLTLARKRLGDRSPAAPLLESATEASDRGVALIQRLLGFARRQRLEPQPVDIGRLLIGMKPMLQQSLGPQIEVILDVSADFAIAEIDRNQLELAILNLAINARDAMPEGGSLHIELRQCRTDSASPPELSAGDYVAVVISDTGIGMDEATIVRAFEPFFTTKKAGVGTGLGLATVHGFVAQSGGAVRLSSTLGRGTVVELWLPKTARPGISGSDAGPSGP